MMPIGYTYAGPPTAKPKAAITPGNKITLPPAVMTSLQGGPGIGQLGPSVSQDDWYKSSYTKIKTELDKKFEDILKQFQTSVAPAPAQQDTTAAPIGDYQNTIKEQNSLINYLKNYASGGAQAAGQSSMFSTNNLFGFQRNASPYANVMFF